MIPNEALMFIDELTWSNSFPITGILLSGNFIFEKNTGDCKEEIHFLYS